MYVAGHVTDVDSEDFDPCRMVKIEEPKTVIRMTDTLPLFEPTSGDAQVATFGNKSTVTTPEMVKPKPKEIKPHVD